ncbi:hypothetical protein ACFOLJ_00310 [Rugamonas sp. CCM 8940]|uniref:hypothetical protein n=1 Tax=Rugamonas sp. CCM 8940 TaxID=2765359 RepID=UPI0018F70A60|nr:hypothetical protein [Rugamonas sp. CCM 8940]MBJ7314351.1 hypothetical protein [Rugamonas sp. CCM 8940]
MALTLLAATATGAAQTVATGSAAHLDRKQVNIDQRAAAQQLRPDITLAQADAPTATSRQREAGAPTAPSAAAPTAQRQPSAWLILLLGAIVIVLRFASRSRVRPFE